MSDHSRWSTFSECVIVSVKVDASTCLGAESGQQQALGRRLTPRFYRWAALHARVNRHGHCETKHQVQGSDLEIVVLNRTIRWEDDKIVYAANRGHAAQIVKAMRTSTEAIV